MGIRRQPEILHMGRVSCCGVEEIVRVRKRYKKLYKECIPIHPVTLCLF